MEVIAHRGIHSTYVRENSAAALRAVLDSRADGVEIDVRITSDNMCVVHHDTKLHSGGRLSRLTYDQIASRDADVMTVAQALDILASYEGVINLEVKHIVGERDRFRGLWCVQELGNLIMKNYSMLVNKVLISSFSLPNIGHSVQHMPSIERAYLAPRALRFSRVYERALRYGCSAVHLSVAHLRSRSSVDFIRRVHDGGMKVRVYTVNSVRELDRCFECEVDGIFTDHVEQMRKGMGA